MTIWNIQYFQYDHFTGLHVSIANKKSALKKEFHTSIKLTVRGYPLITLDKCWSSWTRLVNYLCYRTHYKTDLNISTNVVLKNIPIFQIILIIFYIPNIQYQHLASDGTKQRRVRNL
jgi:hypothetical protein